MSAPDPARKPPPDTPRGAAFGVSPEEELAGDAALLARVERALDLTRDFLTPEELEEHRCVLLSLARCHPGFSPRRADRGSPVPGESGVVPRRDEAALTAASGAHPLPGESGVVPRRDEAALEAASGAHPLPGESGVVPRRDEAALEVVGEHPPPDASGFVRVVDDAALVAAAARRGGRRGGAT